MKQALKEAGYCLVQSLKHPRTQIALSNPGGTVSPIPWWGSGSILVIGIITWILLAFLKIPEMTEPARAMVYLPLGNIFGMTIKIRNH